MNEKSLEEIALRIQRLLEEYEIDTKLFQLIIQVSEDYYDQIKANFQVRNSILDAIVGARGTDWNVDLMIYALPASDDFANEIITLIPSVKSNVMNESLLEDLFLRIKAELDAYHIDIQSFYVKIFVRRMYYDKIKRNFKDFDSNPKNDIVVGTGGKNWGIELLSPPTLGVPYEDRFL
jgi:hypothetical protein